MDNWKMVWRSLVGGGITAVVGTYLVPVMNQLLAFVPQTKLLIQGLTPHVLLAYGLAFALADWINNKWIRQ